SAYRTIWGGKSGCYLPVALEPSGQAFSLEQLTLPGWPVQWSGRWLQDRARLRELTLIIPLALCLLYLILAAQFESLIQPLIVLAVLPLSMVGALVALWTTGSSVNLLSLIGMVVTTGIVVNDAILKVDIINRERRAGHSLAVAIQRGGRRRIRPILMTTLTTILALLPILLADGLGAALQRPLALTVIGGLSMGTLVSLYGLPLLYWWTSRKEERAG
ncbi:MAG: efflux RND transporter permease subunit, partial [Lewinella sp.]|nr:efflux RND transporter permease subunit [Lewinella sp.]